MSTATDCNRSADHHTTDRIVAHAHTSRNTRCATPAAVENLRSGVWLGRLGLGVMAQGNQFA